MVGTIGMVSKAMGTLLRTMDISLGARIGRRDLHGRRPPQPPTMDGIPIGPPEVPTMTLGLRMHGMNGMFLKLTDAGHYSLNIFNVLKFLMTTILDNHTVTMD